VAVSKTLRTLASNVTVHGFRSTFRTWGAEEAKFASEVLEHALAHVDTNKVRAAYQRSDFLAERRKLAEAWGQFLSERCKPLAEASAQQ
jgi:integrase